MRVDYTIGCGRWTPYPDGRIEISDHAWKTLSKDEWGTRIIPCQSGFTDDVQLLAVAAAIDNELEKMQARHSERKAS